jgi:hypothetical protein
MSIDPRLMDRRRTVAEDNAKRNVGRLLRFLTLALVVGAAVWLVFSPWLSVSQVDASGISASTAHSILVDRGVVAGTPMIRISPSATERALMEDPWIASAEITLHWPDRVSVVVEERTPIAWTETTGGWTRRAVDGVALPSDPEPDAEMAHIEMPDLPSEVAANDPDMAGALEFIENLAVPLRAGTVVYQEGGEIWAMVDGHRVRLGRGVEMAAKALSLQALLEENLPDNAVLILIAPTNPAWTPSSPVEVGSQSGEAGMVPGDGEVPDNVEDGEANDDSG